MRIVLLTTRNDHIVLELVKNIIEKLPDCTIDILFERHSRKLKSRLRAQMRNISHNGLIWIPYRLAVAIMNGLGKRTKNINGTTLLSHVHEIPNVSLKIVSSYHSKELWKEVGIKGYDLGIVFGTRILKKELFSLPKKGMINVHQGLIPLYRGRPPAFWELYNNENETGITIHKVVEDLDAGAIVLQKKIPILPNDTMESLSEKLDNLVIESLPSAIKVILDQNFELQIVDLTKGRVYTQPTVREILELKKKRRLARVY